MRVGGGGCARVGDRGGKRKGDSGAVSASWVDTTARTGEKWEGAVAAKENASVHGQEDLPVSLTTPDSTNSSPQVKKVDLKSSFLPTLQNDEPDFSPSIGRLRQTPYSIFDLVPQRARTKDIVGAGEIVLRDAVRGGENGEPVTVTVRFLSISSPSTCTGTSTSTSLPLACPLACPPAISGS